MAVLVCNTNTSEDERWWGRSMTGKVGCLEKEHGAITYPQCCSYM